MGKDKKKQMIRLCVSFSILVMILIVVLSIMIRYEVEGDKNMPFTLSKIIIVSKAGGESVEGESKWNYDIYQYNDVYFYIDKNEEYSDKNHIIKNIKIENINVIEAPQMGEVKAYMPDSTKEESFKYTDEYIINDSLTYKGAAKSSSQTLEVGNQGGKVLVSFVNTNIKKYSSNEETQINYDTLLKKVGVSSEQIQFKVSFDFTIELSNSSYKANIVLDLPQGDVIKNGTGNLEKTDMSDVVFKRIK